MSGTRPVPFGGDPLLRIRELMLDADEDGTVAQSLAGLRESARSVRDQLLRYSVGPGYSYWPSTDRWRSTSNRHVSGYGIRHLIEAVRERG